MRVHHCVCLVAVLVALAAGPVSAAEDRTAELPLTRATLFTSGVGYFERSGPVEGGRRVEMSFRTEDINDILKSLVVVGTEEATVSYASRDPVSKALKSFAVDLTGNPTLGELLNQLRGARVTVRMPQPFTGTILGVEKRTRQLEDDGTITVDVVNVVSDGTVRSFELPELVDMQLEDKELQAELHQALAVLARARDQDKKPVTIHVGGEGEQRVTAGYVVEAPVWKTSYRLVLQGGAEPFLQGWAIVENTTDADWKDIHLTLVSGQPISFVQDLYTPLYMDRPEVAPPVRAAVRPQIYKGEALKRAPQAARAREKAAAPAEYARKRVLADRADAARAVGRGGGMGGAVNALGFQALKTVTEGAGAVAELFEYPVAGKVTIERQSSAMLPVASGPVEAERLSIFDAEAHEKYPLNGLELTNTTGLFLMHGPVTVFDAGTYAGDARLDDTPSGGEQLISYAVDQKREVAVHAPSGPTTLESLKIVRGVLVATRKHRMEKRYEIDNKAPEDRTVLVQHPYRPDWKLVEPEGVEPATGELYRFRVDVPGGTAAKPGEAKLTVVEEKTVDQRIGLSGATPEQILVWTRSDKATDELSGALEKIAQRKREIANLQRDLAEKQRRVNELEQDQKRTRENMQVLDKNNPLYAKYVEKLSDQEEEFSKLTKEIRSLRETIDTRERELMDDLESLTVR